MTHVYALSKAAGRWRRRPTRDVLVAGIGHPERLEDVAVAQGEVQRAAAQPGQRLLQLGGPLPRLGGRVLGGEKQGRGCEVGGWVGWGWGWMWGAVVVATLLGVGTAVLVIGANVALGRPV